MLDKLRLRLAAVDAVPYMALLGVGVGVLSAAVIIAFRLIVDYAQMAFLPSGQVENFEGLDWPYRMLIPVGGGLAIGLLLQWSSKKYRSVGVVHVMERLAYHQGHLPLGNAVMQFVGAAACLVSGQSVGREGPSIHLGATSGSLVGQQLGLPNNTIRTLVACGVASGIAASFNTPIAGVIFAMEVVMMEYTITGFAPVILAAVSATTLTRAVYAPETAASPAPLDLVSLWELPYILLMGLVIGGLSALFIQSLSWFTRLGANRPIWQRTTLAGVITGMCALFVPEVMGLGYDTVTTALLGEAGLWLVVGLVAAKMVATTVGLGLGLPGGLIGPTLVIGAAAGAAMGFFAQALFPGQSSGFYAMLGMGAMMAATLQAPLAALMALLELTANSNIILPGMLAVIVSGITTNVLFGREAVYLMLIRARGLDYRNDPVAQSLRRVGVASIMNRNFVAHVRNIGRADAESLLAEQKPAWIIVEQDLAPHALLPALDLARELERSEAEQMDLMAIPAVRQDLAAVHLQATLQEALDAMNEAKTDALYVWRMTAPQIRKIYGVLTRQDVESAPLA